MIGDHTPVHDAIADDPLWSAQCGTQSHGGSPVHYWSKCTVMIKCAELDAAVCMLTGVVACPSLMYGTLPDDDIIGAAVDMVLRSADLPPAPARTVET